MISFTAFCRLKRGDVVLWRGDARVVQRGPADDGPPPKRRGHAHVKFCRWVETRWPCNASPVATYCYNDVKDKIAVPRKRIRARVVFEKEKQHLRAIGYNLTEAARVAQMHEAMGGRRVTISDLLTLKRPCGKARP